MNVWYGIGLGVAVGFQMGALWNTIIGLWQSSQMTKERQLLINKLLSGGDATAVYNLNLADKVSQGKEVVKAAIKSEVERRETPEPIETPWNNHPDYAGCDITFDVERGVVMVFDPEAVDGPDCWEEPIDVFNEKLEEIPLTS